MMCYLIIGKSPTASPQLQVCTDFLYSYRGVVLPCWHRGVIQHQYVRPGSSIPAATA
jgi:hypothetical protein